MYDIDHMWWCKTKCQQIAHLRSDIKVLATSVAISIMIVTSFLHFAHFPSISGVLNLIKGHAYNITVQQGTWIAPVYMVYPIALICDW